MSMRTRMPEHPAGKYARTWEHSNREVRASFRCGMHRAIDMMDAAAVEGVSLEEVLRRIKLRWLYLVEGDVDGN